MGREPQEATHLLKFLVIKASSTYNVILGQTVLHAFKAIPSPYHLKVKFLTRIGLGEEIGDQKTTRSYYIAALRTHGVWGKSFELSTWMPVRMMSNEEEQRRI